MVPKPIAETSTADRPSFLNSWKPPEKTSSRF
jgi:hypothetical protein